MVATNSQSRCREQGIPFYRFSPKLKDVIAGSETDNEKLFNMVIQTRIDTREQGMEELVGQFHTIAKASLHLAPKVEGVGGEETEQERREDEVEQEKREEGEVIANVRHHVNANHQLNMRPHSSQATLSDIEESLETNTRKSFKSRPVHAKSVHVFREPAWVTSDTCALAVGQASSGYDDAEEECRPKDHRPSSSEESTSTNLPLAGERSDFDNTSLEQSVVKKESQTRTNSIEVRKVEQEVMTESQESSVFSVGIASSNELQTSLRAHDQDKDDVNGNSTDLAVQHHEEPVLVGRDFKVSTSIAPHEPLVLAELEEPVENMTSIDASHDHNHHSSFPTGSGMSSSQEFKSKVVMESEDTGGKDSLSNMPSPAPIVRPFEREQSVKNQTSVSQPSLSSGAAHDRTGSSSHGSDSESLKESEDTREKEAKINNGLESPTFKTRTMASVEPEGLVKNQTDVNPMAASCNGAAVHHNFPMSSVQGSEGTRLNDSEDTGEKYADFRNGFESHLTPLSPVKPVGLVENPTSTGQPSSLPQMLEQVSSQETLQDTNNAGCIALSSLHSSSDAVDGREGNMEKRKEEICINQNQQGQDKGISEIADPPESVVNGVTVIRSSIPEGSTHSLPINLESPQTNGPHKNTMSQSKVEENAVTPTPDGHPLLSESEPVVIHSTHAELHHEPSSLVNGCKSNTHTQIHNLQTTGEQQKAVPQPLEVEHRLNLGTQQEMQSNFPYQYETEI